MIWINKSSEPDSWLHHRLTNGATYERTEDLARQLLEDQGYICAYCMRRIPVADRGSTEDSRIEHIIPQSELSDKEKMDFRNLVICCPGAIMDTSKKKAHCDRRKAENRIHLSPLDKNFIATIEYGSDGLIKSTDSICDQEINEILNLNIPLLKANRKAVKDVIIRKLDTKSKKDWKKTDIAKLLRFFSSKNEKGEYPAYCGVAQWYLSRKLTSM